MSLLVGDLHQGHVKGIGQELGVGIAHQEAGHITAFHRSWARADDIHDFLILPPVDPEDIYQKCLDIISAMNEQHAMSKKLLSCIYSEHKYKEQLLIWSGAKSLHHNLRGGLIWHMYRMAELALLLPYRDICMNADKYENFMQKAYAKYPHDAQPTADFIARHSRIPATEEQLKEYIGNLDSENPYIKQLSRFQGTWPDIAKTLIACQIAEAVANVYPTLDPCLMIAGILIDMPAALVFYFLSH